MRRVISISPPISGLVDEPPSAVLKFMSPTFAPKNNALLNRRLDWAAPAAGKRTASARLVAIHRTVRMGELLIRKRI